MHYHGHSNYYPGHQGPSYNRHSDLFHNLTSTQAPSSHLNPRDNPTTPELLADLKTLPDSSLSPAGRTIKSILLKDFTTGTTPQDLKTVYVRPPSGSPASSKACRADACCIWSHIVADMVPHFQDRSTGQCSSLARDAIRLGFHDAGTWSKTLGGGGADGSIALSDDEWKRPENRDLEEIVARMKLWYAKWNLLLSPGGKKMVSMADLIQVGASVATVTCPLGPRVRTFVGRNDTEKEAPVGRLPDVFSDAGTIVRLFEDKTIPLEDLIALIGAHTTSTQHFVDPSRDDAPQDSTPGVWDVSWYNETVSEDRRNEDVFVFPSDAALARHEGVEGIWDAFARSEQGGWNDVSGPPFEVNYSLGTKRQRRC